MFVSNENVESIIASWQSKLQFRNGTLTFHFIIVAWTEICIIALFPIKFPVEMLP